MFRKISPAVIKRLPRYYRYLSDLLEAKISRISSKELSIKMNVTASQIRQDLNCFGGFGQQGYGYNVENLFEEIGKILGVDQNYSYVIIGAGNMGRAIANYVNFGKRGFNMLAIFDVDSKIIGTTIGGGKVMHLDSLEEFLKDKKVDIGMLCVPYDKTREIAERVVKAGVKGVWNFSPMDLNLSCDTVIENVHLSDSLMVLGYKMKNGEY